MPCNPAIGGTGKGHLVREVDALGGRDGAAPSTDTFLQSPACSTRGKGPAVHSPARPGRQAPLPRATCCGVVYFQPASDRCARARSCDILTEGRTGERRCAPRRATVIACRACVVCGGVYLKSRIIIGEYSEHSGPQGLVCGPRALSGSLEDLGFALRRFKTGTPARVDVRSIDFDRDGAPARRRAGRALLLPDRRGRSGHGRVLPAAQPCPVLPDLHQRGNAPHHPGKPAPRPHGARRYPGHRRALLPQHRGQGGAALPTRTATSSSWSRRARYQSGMVCAGHVAPACPRTCSGPCTARSRAWSAAELTRLAYAIEYDCIDPTRAAPRRLRAKARAAGCTSPGRSTAPPAMRKPPRRALSPASTPRCTLQEREPLILTRDMGLSSACWWTTW